MLTTLIGTSTKKTSPCIVKNCSWTKVKNIKGTVTNDWVTECCHQGLLCYEPSYRSLFSTTQVVILQAYSFTPRNFLSLSLCPGLCFPAEAQQRKRNTKQTSCYFQKNFGIYFYIGSRVWISITHTQIALGLLPASNVCFSVQMCTCLLICDSAKVY